MTADINSVLKAPSWTMDDAYVAIGAPHYEASFRRTGELVDALEASKSPIARDALPAALGLYDEAVTLSSSLGSFLKCLGAKDSGNDAVPAELSRLNVLTARLERAAEPLFAALAELPADDPIRSVQPISDWAFELEDASRNWKRRLSASDRDWLGAFEAQVFKPLGETFKTLQKGVDFEAENARGEKERIRAAKLVSVIKGAPDRTLRANVNAGLNASYGARADLYAALLNTLHGFRLAAFGRAGVDPLTVSLHQNRMSEGALRAMRGAILKHIDTVRDAVRVRAPYFDDTRLKVYDLMAPAPERGKTEVPPLIPYAEGIGIVKTALGSVHPEMAAFIDMMLERRWIDAVLSDAKVGGAFYSRFNEFKCPRVFSSYTGTITTVLQQGHELGHAFHYWVMRDLPTVQTEFPMTLTETASTFNEAVIRAHLLANAASRDDVFGMLWQEMRSCANFLMNTMVRMDFELAFLKERASGVVSARRAVELMRRAWADWYGESTDGADDYLWAYKLHYYKTDQLIYNYPYTVGYLLSQGLMHALATKGEDFYPFYKALLRDTGRMTVDGIIEKHFGADPAGEAFWEDCLAAPLAAVRRFKAEFSDPNVR